MTRNHGYNNKYTATRKHPATEPASLTPANKRPAFEKIPHEPEESKFKIADIGGCETQFLVKFY